MRAANSSLTLENVLNCIGAAPSTEPLLSVGISEIPFVRHLAPQFSRGKS